MSIAHTPTAHTATAPAVPRSSASLVVVNAHNEVLLVQRNPKARAFGGVHVFPGGNFDPKQDESLQMTAIRETFEESGLLLASSSTSSPPENTVLGEAREEIHAQRLLFQAFLNEHRLKPDVSALLPFTEWITPIGAPRRFRAQFFVAFLSSSSPSAFFSGQRQEQIPTPDGGQEVVTARFIHPQDVLAEFQEKKITFMPPQYYILFTLSGILQGRENTADQRQKIEMLSRGPFGGMTINPKILPESDAEGRMILTYEGDETRGGSKGRLHRALARVKGGAATELTLLRNFDIFTGIEPRAFNARSHL